jgi:hypothetical protein
MKTGQDTFNVIDVWTVENAAGHDTLYDWSLFQHQEEGGYSKATGVIVVQMT